MSKTIDGGREIECKSFVWKSNRTQAESEKEVFFPSLNTRINVPVNAKYGMKTEHTQKKR